MRVGNCFSPPRRFVRRRHTARSVDLMNQGTRNCERKCPKDPFGRVGRGTPDALKGALGESSRTLYGSKRLIPARLTDGRDWGEDGNPGYLYAICGFARPAGGNFGVANSGDVLKVFAGCNSFLWRVPRPGKRAGINVQARH